MTDKPSEYMTLGEAAKYIGVSVGTLYRWKAGGKLNFYKIAGTIVRIRRSDLEALIEIDTSTADKEGGRGMSMRISYGKKLVKDILLSYAFFYGKEERFKNTDEDKHQYFLGLLHDLKNDLIWEPTNRKHIEELAGQTYDKIVDKTAKIEDYYVYIGFNLLNFHFAKDHEEDFRKVNDSFDDQLSGYYQGTLWAGNGLVKFVETLSDKQIENFQKKTLKTIFNLELTCMARIQEHIQKTTGKEVMVMSSTAGIIL